MDATNFDQVTRALSSRLPRRAVAGLLGLGALGVTGLAHATSVNAGEHKHKHKQQRKKRKITTGKASYCFVEGTCADCTRDTDCEGQFGAGAACIVCAECAGQSANATGCVGVNDI